MLVFPSPGIPGANSNNPFILTGIGVNMYQSQIIQGGQWGDIYGYKFARASDGSVLVNDAGTPAKTSVCFRAGFRWFSG